MPGPEESTFVTIEDMLVRVLKNQYSMMRWMDAPPSTFESEMAETETLLERTDA